MALGDVEYGKRIVSCLMNHYRDSVEIHAFGQELDLLEMLMKKESDTIETTYKWQYRTFYFVPVGQDDETLKHVLEPFKDWIIYRFSNRVKHNLLYDCINQAADTFLDRFLENNNN